MRKLILLLALCVSRSLAQEAADAGAAEDVAEAPEMPAEDVSAGTDSASSEVKTMLGMSILGNEEAPKALVIVPWKSSRIGEGLGVSNSMDDRASPVDRDVFMREVRYYELRSGTAE